jgi:ferredoxin
MMWPATDSKKGNNKTGNGRPGSLSSGTRRSLALDLTLKLAQSTMATTASLLHLSTPVLCLRHPGGLLPRRSQEARFPRLPPRAYKVTIEHGGESRVVEVEEDETILSRALDEGLDVPHDCKLGVCMTCPARLISGEVDQSDGMLSDDVVAKGYALLCAAYPRSDCTIRVIPEDELLQVQLATADD